MTKKTGTYKYALGISAQALKRNALVCGDLFVEERTPDAATFLLLDGIGSGMKAYVAAQLFASRLLSLLRRGFTAREACASIVKTMHAVRTQDVLFAAFTLVRVLNDGNTVILSYEMPAPLLLDGDRVEPAPQRFFTLSGEVLAETLFHLEPGNGFFVFSDGITQAGMGGPLCGGWGLDGVRDYLNSRLSDGAEPKRLPALALEQARLIGDGVYGDDATAVFFTCRPANTVHILTGPPADAAQDRQVVRDFIAADGAKIICGSTTADIFARYSERPVKTGPGSNPFEPPEYFIAEVDMVTEGALTLNQLYNIIGEKQENLDPASPVSKLLLLLRQADRIYFHVGQAVNPGHGSQIFKQLGVLPRQVIVPLLAEKLRASGKLVIIEQH